MMNLRVSVSNLLCQMHTYKFATLSCTKIGDDANKIQVNLISCEICKCAMRIPCILC